jgi:rfaE bifunctional protein kinase chain/domain
VTVERLSELVAGFPSKRVAVVGDFFLDKYLEFDPDLAEISIETGLVARQVVKVRHSPGAAGNVVVNLVSLGAKVVPLGLIGDDGEGYELRQDLARLGCETDYLTVAADRHTPTYLKPCDAHVPGLAGEAERYDTKNRSPLPPELQALLVESFTRVAAEVDAVVIVDQVDEPECGVVTASMRTAIAEAGRRHSDTVFFVDSRCRAGEFRGVTLKPNKSEALAAVGLDGTPASDELVLAAGCDLYARTGKPVFVTRSELGILVFCDGATDKPSCTPPPPQVVDVPAIGVEEPLDFTGAGDSATSAAVLALASGATPAEAALLANLAASITVKHLGGTGAARPEELRGRLELWHAQGKAIARV